jgi:hypothetical protein
MVVLHVVVNVAIYVRIGSRAYSYLKGHVHTYVGEQNTSKQMKQVPEPRTNKKWNHQSTILNLHLHTYICKVNRTFMHHIIR